MSFGITPQGFNQKRLDDILTEAEQDLAQITDPVTGDQLQPDFDSSDPTMQVVKIPLEAASDNWELGTATYNITNPANAVGPALDNVNNLRGITREPALPSIAYNVLCTGTIGATVTATAANPVLISDVFGTQNWAISESFTFDASGEASVIATATTTGPIAAPAGTLTNIVTPKSGWASVNNPFDAVLGAYQESDTAFRRRGDVSTLAPATGPAEAVYSALLNLPGVTFARVYSNREITTDANGIAPKTQATVVVGGDNDAIATEIFKRSGAAVAFQGNTVVTFTDIQGFPYAVSFYRPIEVPIYVQVDLQVVDASIFPSNGADLVKQAIVTYSQQGAAGLGIQTGFNNQFQPSENIVRSHLYTPINSVPGASILDVLIGTDPGALSANDIPIAFNEIGLFETDNIVVNLS